MAAVNYAEKYSQKVDERFALASITEAAINREYDFDGVNTINVYSIPTSPLNNYTINGISRYGTPEELGNAKQTMVLSQDKSFTFTIDRRSYDDTMMTQEAGRALRREVDEVIIPTIDTYRLTKIVGGAGTTATPAAITKDNAYTMFLKGVTTLLDNKVPMAGSIAYISSNFYTQIRLDPAFIKSGDMSQDMLVRGQVGMVEGVSLIYAPTVYLPENVEFLLTNRIATVAAEKITDYRIHDNPPGINGWLVEGRIYYDAFVLDNKNKAIYVHSKPTA